MFFLLCPSLATATVWRLHQALGEWRFISVSSAARQNATPQAQTQPVRDSAPVLRVSVGTG